MDPSPPSPSQEGKRPADESQTQNSALKSYVRILSYGSRNGGIVAMVLGLICAVGSGVALPLMNVVFGNLAGEFNRYFMPGARIDEHAFKANVNKNSLYIVYLFIGKFVLTYISMFCFRMISLRASASLRLEYIRALFAQPVSKLDETSVGTVTHAITSLSNTIQQSVSDRLAILFQSLALLVAAYAIAFRYSWALTLAVSSSILFVVIAFSFTIPFLVKGQQMVDRADEKHAAIAAETFGSIRTVLSLGAEVPLTKKYMSWVDEARQRAGRLCPATALQLCLIFFAMYCSYALAFWFGLKLYRDGHIGNVNTVIIVFFSVLLVVSVLGSIASPLMAIIKATSASGPFFDMIQSERVATDGLKSPAVSSNSDIVFDSVTFAYPTRAQTQVLKNFSARFPSGKTTALVGPSGSGKSTVVALLERWYQLEPPEETTAEKGISPGSVLVDGHNINLLDLKWWRTQIGLVEQEPVLFNESIYQNVSAGLIGTEWEHESEAAKMELVVNACREAFADEFIDRLPSGYLTIVGEGGIMLSGGQRQRIAIARSIVRQPTILILDEATSSIDVRGEQIVQAALDRVSKNRTTVMIAHRLSTVRKADQIVVVQDGTNIEQGSPQELMDRGGFYYSLVHAQHLQASPEPELIAKSEEGISPSKQVDPVKSMVSEAAADEESTEEGSVKSIKKQGAFRTLWQLLSEQRSHWPSYVLTLAGAMGVGSAFPLQSWLFAKLVQVFQFTGQKLVDAANFWSLMFFILAIAMAVFYFDLGYVSTLISVKFASTYRKDYFESIIQKPIAYFDQEENASGTLISRLSTDPKQLQELFGLGGIFPIISIFSLIGCTAISFSFGWKLAAVAFFAALPFILAAAYLRIRYEIQFEGMNAEVYADSSKFATEAIQAFRTVSALTMEGAIVKRYEDLLLKQRSKAMRKAWYATLIFAFSDSIDLCAMALTFWYGGQLLATREYDPVAFFVVYIAIVQGGQSAGQFFSFGPNIAQTVASVRRILATRSTAVKLDPMSQPTPTQALSSQADIHFHNVSFHYPSRNLAIFQHLNVTIHSGQFVAFVGPSGCGKSTLISLLERFYEPSQGSIEVGGQDIRSVDCASYRRSLSLVAQEPRLFEGTIRENLLLGLAADDPAADEDHLINACKQAEIHDFITSLPDGYATELGINARASLSGGQKQRLCIARALLRKPRLLLLDEATSSLDSTSERLIQESMEKLAGKKSMTIIAVAHRLATIQKADVIFVLGEEERGAGSRIVEQGSHHELLQRRGVYWQMCQAQALDQ